VGAARRHLPLLGPAVGGGEEVARHAAAALGQASVASVLALLCAIAVTRGGRRIAALAMIAAVADVAFAHRDLNETAPATFFRYRPEVLGLLPPGHVPRVFVWDYVVHRPPGIPFLLSELMQVRPGFPPRLGRALALQSYLYPASYVRWGLYGGFDRDLLGFTPRAMGELVGVLSRVRGTPAYLQLLRLGAVDAVLALHDEAPAGLGPLGVIEGPLRLPVRAFSVPDPRPRAYVVGSAMAAPGEAALRVLLDPSFDPSRLVVLPEAPVGPPPSSPLRSELRVTRDAPDRFEAEVDVSAEAWLVRVAAYDPGWRLRLDGDAAPLLHANQAFQGVHLPAGRHRVEIVYRPRAVLAGLALSALACPAAAVLFLRWGRRP
jgi:hypothetical protein